MIAPVRFDIGFEGQGLLGNPAFISEAFRSKQESLDHQFWTLRRWHQIIHEDVSIPGASWIVAGLRDELHNRLIEIGAGDYSLRNGDPSMFQRPYLELYDRGKAMLFRLETEFPLTEGFPVRITG